MSVYDFKTMMAVKMSRMLNRKVAPSDLTFGVPSAPTFTTPRNTAVNVIIDGVTYQVAYDRYNIGVAVAMVTVRSSVSAEDSSIPKVIAGISNRFGIDLIPSDIASIEEINESVLKVTFSDECLAYCGTMSLAWTTGIPGYFPKSGPGPKKLLFGDTNAGYFGRVTEAEMFNKVYIYNKLMSALPNPVGRVMTTDTIFYFKFFYKNRFVFIPSVPIISNVSWSEVYQMGAVYSPTQEVHQRPTGIAEVKQTSLLRAVEGNTTWLLSPRLPMVNTVDPVASVAYNSPTVGGEFWDLVRHVSTRGAYSTGTWDQFDTIGYANSEELVQNSTLDNRVHAVTPNYRVGNVADKITARASYWRPVLELVNDLDLLQGVELRGIDVYGRLPSVVVNITPPPVADRLKTVTNFTGTMEGIDVPFAKVTVSPVVNVINFKWETMSTLKATPPVTISTSPTAIVKNIKWQFSPILAPLVKTTILR